MKQYLDLLEQSLTWDARRDRTGTGTHSSFGTKREFDLREGFPLLTTKKLHWKSIVNELIWMIGGGTNTKWLNEHGVTIWDEWADENGDLGPIYGHQWRKWRKFKGVSHRSKSVPQVQFEAIDQLADVIKKIKTNPFDRRLIVSAWNVANLAEMKLPPCHMMYQFYVSADKKYLDIQMYQRSVDIFLGLPYNIAGYALLLKMVAYLTHKVPRYYHWVGGDTHLYLNHVDQAKEQLTRKPKYLPQVTFMDGIPSIDAFREEFIVLEGYESHPHIKAEISV